MSPKTRRGRYVLKWNGPGCVREYRRNRRHAKACMGHGSTMDRFISTAYECRFQGFFPRTEAELARRAGVPEGRLM